MRRSIHFEILCELVCELKYVSLCVKIESGPARPAWSTMLYFIAGLSRVKEHNESLHVLSAAK